MKFNSHLLCAALISLSHISNTEDECEEHAEGADDDVAHSQEVVLSTKCVSG